MAKGDRTGNRKTREQRRTFFCRFFGGFVFFVGEFYRSSIQGFYHKENNHIHDIATIDKFFEFFKKTFSYSNKLLCIFLII